MGTGRHSSRFPREEEARTSVPGFSSLRSRYHHFTFTYVCLVRDHRSDRTGPIVLRDPRPFQFVRPDFLHDRTRIRTPSSLPLLARARCILMILVNYDSIPFVRPVESKFVILNLLLDKGFVNIFQLHINNSISNRIGLNVISIEKDCSCIISRLMMKRQTFS